MKSSLSLTEQHRRSRPSLLYRASTLSGVCFEQKSHIAGDRVHGSTCIVSQCQRAINQWRRGEMQMLEQRAI